VNFSKPTLYLNQMEQIMTEASEGQRALNPAINWKMSAALENVPRGESELAEVTSLAGAVAAWQALDPAHRADALLTLERSLVIDGETITSLSGEAIARLAARLPGSEQNVVDT
jgi:hypothetical protein